jgi:epsilon-lactone hydrolase
MSVQNQLVKALLRLTRKPIYASEYSLRQHIARERIKETHDPPPSIQRACQIEAGTWQGAPCYTMRPFQGKGINRHVLYLHGGGYVFEMASAHWQLLSTLINRSNVTATVPLYPLAPEHTYRDTYPWLLALYQHLCDTPRPEKLTIMGDSAGGGMALSLVQQAIAQGLPHPQQTLLTSPWLDMTLQNPAFRKRDHPDPVLTSAGLLVAARWWAGGDDLASPVLSPINGSLAGIGPLLLTVGTDESFYFDSLLLKERALAKCLHLEFIEKAGLAHLFIFAPIPEAKPVIDRFVERLKHATEIIR